MRSGLTYSWSFSGDDGVEKTALDSHRSSMVDANTSLLCQLHSHQQRHRQQQFDTQSQMENDRLKLFDNHSPKMRKLTALESQVNLRLQIMSQNAIIWQYIPHIGYINYFSFQLFITISQQQKRRRRYQKIDRFFLVVFPLMFILFNAGYWICYFSFNPMNMLTDKYDQEEEDGVTTTEGGVTFSSTIPPEMTAAPNLNW